MKHGDGTFTTQDGLTLFYQRWLPEQSAHTVLVIIHGVGEHSGRYQNVVNHFVPLGYAVYGFDQRGFGQSSGQRGHVNAYAEFYADIRRFLQLVGQQTADDVPLFLYGHSLGGLISLGYVMAHPEGVAGLVASAPALGTDALSPVLVWAAKVMARIMPTFTLESGLDETAVSRDPAVVDAYKNDPLVHSKGTPKAGTAYFAAQKEIAEHPEKITTPLLMLHGDADTLTIPAASKQFFDQVPFADKQYIRYPGGYHESHNDIHYADVMQDVQTWLEQHMS